MIAGGAPIDWAQPLMPHITAKQMKRADDGMAPAAAEAPRTPMQRFIATEMIRPVAMKRLMLEPSARKPFTNFPTA